MSFAAATDFVLTARIQLSGAQTLHDLHEALRTLTHGLSWDTRPAGPDAALEVTLGKRQELPLHATHAAGLTRFNTLHEQTRICRVHVSNVPPGFFQTLGFATALMEQITAFQSTPDDVTEAVAARIARCRFLYEGGHRYGFLMEESVLRYQTAVPEAMRGQLRHLLAVIPLASVSLGIIPSTARRTVWPLEAFYVHDDTMAVVETPTAEIKVAQPRELADYAKAFTGLAEMAMYGDADRALIRGAIDALE
ncbi:DUF5753 domain-containing protein [Streptomyces sp. CLV115]|uniref:DUF5753 domain-containing protein n=1 Tax=Streptomyces sp. CLV115 TaxID=3138502 RepID=UPI00313B25C0